MIKQLIKIFFLLSTVFVISQAQWSLGVAYNSISDQIFWIHGASFQLEYTMPINLQRTYVVIDGTYSVFFNSGKLPDLAVPAVMGFHREFSVESYQFFDVLAKTEHRFSDSDSYLFASIGFGVCYHSANPVSIREWIDSGGQMVPSFRTYKPAKYNFEPSYRLAIGYNISLFTKLSIKPELCYYNSFLSSIIRFPVNVGLYYEL